MRKIVFAGFLALSLICSIAFASPVVDLQQGETAAGFDVSTFTPRLSDNSGSAVSFSGSGAADFYVQHGLTDRFTLGLEFSNFNAAFSVKATDITLQYKLDNHFKLLLGDRNYDTNIGVNDSQLLWGVSASTPLGSQWNGYAAFKATSDETEWQLGVNKEIAQNLTLDLAFKNHNYDLGGGANLVLNGPSLGLTYKF